MPLFKVTRDRKDVFRSVEKAAGQQGGSLDSQERPPQTPEGSTANESSNTNGRSVHVAPRQFCDKRDLC